MEKKVEQVIENLKKNNMVPHYVETKKDVMPLVKSLLKAGDTVAVGGSVTLAETGVMELLQCGEYTYLDRYAPDLTAEGRQEVFIRSMQADAYLCSSNAVTLQGELYNVDGNANRVAAIAFGPKRVILVVGAQKIVDNMAQAVKRVKTIAAPLNAKRLNCNTYCQKNGHCLHPDGGMTEGCTSPARICCSYLVTGFQRNPDRIHVILVGEPCGY